MGSRREPASLLWFSLGRITSPAMALSGSVSLLTVPGDLTTETSVFARVKQRSPCLPERWWQEAQSVHSGPRAPGANMNAFSNGARCLDRAYSGVVGVSGIPFSGGPLCLARRQLTCRDSWVRRQSLFQSQCWMVLLF